MTLVQAVALAVLSMAALAALRVTRVRLGRSPLPEGRGRRAFLVAFVVVPPIAFAALNQPAIGALGLVVAVLTYIGILAIVVAVTAMVALTIGDVRPTEAGRLARVALIGSVDDRNESRFDPPMTPQLANDVATVHTANLAFPRGPAFSAQVDRPDFQADWEALDDATRTLERQIAEDYLLNVGVAFEAARTAGDARSRLDALRRLAFEHGQAWAAG
jgi:hypothetical protein